MPTGRILNIGLKGEIMKILILTLAVLSCGFASAQDSDYERGFNEGKLSCKETSEAWSCSTYPDRPAYAIAATKSEALIKLSKHDKWVAQDITRGLYSCRKL